MGQGITHITSKTATPSLKGLSSLPSDINFTQLLEEASNPLQRHNLNPNLVQPQNAQLGKGMLPGSLETLVAAQHAPQLAQVDSRQRREQGKEDFITPKNINKQLKLNRLDISPIQLFIDRSVDALEGLSQMESKVNDLIEQFIQGKASIDEVSMETAKLNLAVSFATTVITTATQTFKEILQIPI